MCNAVALPGKIFKAFRHKPREGFHNGRGRDRQRRRLKNVIGPRFARRQVHLEQKLVRALGRPVTLGIQNPRGPAVHHGQLAGKVQLHGFALPGKRGGIRDFDRGGLGAFQNRQPVNFAARQQKRAHAIDFSGVRGEFFGIGAHGLDMRQFSIRVHAGHERRPGFAHRRLVFFAVEQPLIHAPSQRVGVKARAAGFLERITGRVQQARAPEAVGLLAGENFGGHVLEQLFKARTVGMVRGQILQHPHQTTHHPAIAAAPKYFLAVGFGLLEIGAVAEIQMFFFVVKIIRGAPPIGHGKGEIFFVPGGGVQTHPGRRPHEQRVAPGPVFTDFGFFVFDVFQRRGSGRMGQDVVKPLAHGRDHLRRPIKEIQFRPGLADAMIIRIVMPTAQLPAIGFAQRQHGVAVFGIAGNAGQRHQAGIPRPLNPARGRPVTRRERMCKLPIRHALHGAEDGHRLDFRREAGGQRDLVGSQWRHRRGGRLGRELNSGHQHNCRDRGDRLQRLIFHDERVIGNKR